MKVILVQDTPGLGEEGDVRDVARGYARNYLFPQGFAVEDNAFNRNRMKEQHKKIEQRKIRKREEAQSLADTLSGLTVTITAAAAENQKLFGAVHENDIKKALEELGYEIEKKSIQLAAPINTTGTYRVPVRVYENVRAQLTVQVLREGEKAPAGEPAAEEPSAGGQDAASAEKPPAASVQEPPAAAAGEPAAPAGGDGEEPAVEEGAED
jgi:large subunit ribosomal protein L9